MLHQYGFRLHTAAGTFRGRFTEFFLVLWKDNKELLLKPNEDGGWEEPIDLTAKVGSYLDPSFRLAPEAVQRLFDDLYAMGYRPTERSDDPGAINRHLQDMRAIAFAKLNIEVPKP